MVLKASIILPRFAAEFRAGVTREINAAFKRSIKGVVTQVTSRVQGSVERLLKTSDIYHEFFGGRLQGELGVPDPSVIDAVNNQWAQGIQVLTFADRTPQLKRAKELIVATNIAGYGTH